MCVCAFTINNQATFVWYFLLVFHRMRKFAQVFSLLFSIQSMKIKLEGIFNFKQVEVISGSLDHWNTVCIFGTANDNNDVNNYHLLKAQFAFFLVSFVYCLASNKAIFFFFPVLLVANKLLLLLLAEINIDSEVSRTCAISIGVIRGEVQVGVDGAFIEVVEVNPLLGRVVLGYQPEHAAEHAATAGPVLVRAQRFCRGSWLGWRRGRRRLRTK